MNFITSFVDHGYRFRALSYDKENKFNLLFLPGGPGLGSEAYLPWLAQKNIQDTNIWLLDFPDDGSNRIPNVSYENWKTDIIPAIYSLSNVILVAHSFAGMFALTVDLEDVVSGLIIIDSAPDNSWQAGLPERIKQYKLPDTSDIKAEYLKNKNNENFKKFTVASWQYFMMKSSKDFAIKLLSNLPYNYHPYDWADKDFHPQFKATWIPKNIPTLIIAGDHDILTPIETFKSDSRFNKQNIKYKLINDASHFPWVEKPD